MCPAAPTGKVVSTISPGNAVDYLDAVTVLVERKHVPKHRLESLMVTLDCPVEMGGTFLEACMNLLLVREYSLLA